MRSGDEKKDVYAAETLFREIGYYQKNKQLFSGSLPAFKEAYRRTPDDLRLLLGYTWSRAKSLEYGDAFRNITRASKLYPDDLRVQQQRALITYFTCNFEEALIENCRGIPKRTKPDVFISGSMQCAEAIERSIGTRVSHALRDHYDVIRTIAWKKALDARKPFQPKPRCKRRKKIKIPDDTPAVYLKRVRQAKRENEGRRDSDLSILESLTDARENQINITHKEKSEHQPPQARTLNIEKLMAEKYLGKMCLQKVFVKEMIEDPRMYSPNYAGTLKILSLAKHCYNKLKMCQEILRARQPYYSIKYHEIETAGQLARRHKEEIKILQDITENYVLDLLKHIEISYKYHHTNQCLYFAEMLKAFADKKPLKLLPKKEEYLLQLYELIGLIYLDSHRYKDGVPGWNMEKRFDFLFGFPLSREPSEDSVIKHNKKQFTDIWKVKARAKKHLKNSTTPLECVWLYYEVALLEFEMKHWDLSRFYAQKAQQMSDILKNYVWGTCTGLLIAKTQLQQRDRHETKVELEKTRKIATHLDNEVTLKFIDKRLKHTKREFLTRQNNHFQHADGKFTILSSDALDVIKSLDARVPEDGFELATLESIEMVEDYDFDKIPTLPVIKERELEIIKNVENIEIQKELEHIFQQMSTLPSSRRMNIMPGVRADDKMDSKKSKLKAKGSIRPRASLVHSKYLKKEDSEFSFS